MSMSYLSEQKPFNSIDKSYVPVKVSALKWKPDGQRLVTGSYDENVNTIDLWKYEETDGCPKKLDSLKTDGDVNGIKFVSSDSFLYCTNFGSLHLVDLIEDKCINRESWGGTDEAMECFDVDDQAMVAVASSDGYLSCFPLRDSRATKVIVGGHIKDDVSCLSFLRHGELATGNLRGQIFIWDLREDMTKPTLSFGYNNEISVGVTKLAPYPLQKYMLVAGGVDGFISTWDLRKPSDPQTIYAAHSKQISELVFHPTRPTNVFTSSYSGEVWHWTNFGELISTKRNENTMLAPTEAKPNVHCLYGQKKFATNCCDVFEDQLVCGTDNDCLVLISPLQLK